MSETTYRLVALAINSLAAFAVLYWLGKFMGESNKMFETLFKEVKEIKLVHVAHANEDDSRHDRLSDDIGDLRVDMASFHPSAEKRRHARRRGDPQ